MALEPYLNVDTVTDTRGPLITLSGTNFQVNNGTGSSVNFPGSSDPNGLGNIIIGYDEGGGVGTDMCSYGLYSIQLDCETNGYVWGDDHKGGSHYLVIGDFNNYSQSVGLVVGRSNSVTNIGSSITGGSLNIASGSSASINGGAFNLASGQHSSVSGGQQNDAIGRGSNVSGGLSNETVGDFSSVSGGSANDADGLYSTVGGGFNRTASGDDDWVCWYLI